MKPLDDCYLYTFVDTTYLQGRNPGELARQLCDGGSDIIQLRAKRESLDQIRALAEAILPVTQKAGIPLVINDHFDIAKEVGSEFCHLGQEDFFDGGFTRIEQLNAVKTNSSHSCSTIQIGLSTHNPDQAARALTAGPAYIGVGPVYATDTKPTAQPVTLEYVRWVAQHIKIPWFAIGGITLANLPQVMAAGARRICVVSAILNAPNVTTACRQFKAALHGC